MVMERWLFVVNPVAGKGKAARRWNRYYRHLATLGKHWDVYHTKCPGDATWIAKKTVEDRAADVVVAVGGDGTIHEVIQGLAGSSIALGILPAGTGNDLARYFGIKKDCGPSDNSKAPSNVKLTSCKHKAAFLLTLLARALMRGWRDM